MDEVDIDVFPIIIMTMVNTKWITSLLMTIPKVPSNFEKFSASNYFVVDGCIWVERLTLTIVFIRSFIWITIVLR